MRIIVLGHMGMLGKRVIAEARRRGHEVRTPFVPGTTRPARLIALHAYDLEGDTVINCAGIVKQRSNSPLDLTMTNAFAPHYVAKLCDEVRSRLIHVSTDCVFTHPGPHTEDSPVSPDDLYARTKLAGEITYAPHLTVRTSFIGHSTRGLVSEVLNSKEIRASNNLLWTGHTAETVAEWLVGFAEARALTGLLHLPGEEYTRYDLVRKLCGHLNVYPTIIRDDSFVADRRLASTRFEGKLPPLDDQLKRMLP